MAIRWNHYDVAFEAYLRDRRIAYVSVDETRRALLANGSLKSMDFIVYGPNGRNLLVDVKGRRASGDELAENWATADDLESLATWQRAFGVSFRAALVFAYDLEAVETRTGSAFPFRDRIYEFQAVWVDDYLQAARKRSERWQTVWTCGADFRRLRFPLEDYLLQHQNHPALQRTPFEPVSVASPA